MMKKTLLTIAVLLLIAAFAFSLTACDKEVKTLQNDFGAVVEGGGFKEGSLLITNEIKADSAEAEEALSAIADQNYNKDGNVYIFDIYVTKDGAKVQPNGRVKITIPNPGITWSDCVVFHVKSDNSVEEIIPTVSESTITFEASSFSYFILAKKTECIHSLDRWIVTEEATCIKEGLQTRKCMLCGEVIFSKTYLADHEYGELIPEVSPTIFEEGVIAHYECTTCGGIFNESKEAVTSTSIEKVVPEISIYLDGEAVAEFTVDETTSGKISLSIADLEVTEGQLVTIRDTANAEVIYEYTVSEKQLSSLGIIVGNIDPTSHKVRTTSVSDINFTINKDGSAELTMDGYKHSGVVIEITSSRSSGKPVLFPMSKVDYYGDPDTQAYVFGLFGSDESTSLRIIDMDTDTVYDYDDLSDTNAWDKWSYSRGANGEIVFAEGVISDWWLAFDIGGDGKITLRLFNLPMTAGETTLSIYRGSTLSESISMEKVVLEVASEEYNHYTWALNNAVFNRTENWLDRIDLEKLFVYRTVIEVERNQEVSVKSGSTTMYCTYLSEVIAPDGAIGKALTSNRIRFNAAGKYVVEYVPFCNIINIYEYVETTPDPEPHEHVYIDGKCECGEIDPDYAPSHKHEYVDSKCECGAVDSNYKGIVIEINGEKYAMNFVTYPTDEVNSYVYGYVYINAGDKLLIRDTESGVVWGYDDIDERFGWNTWDYHRGDNGEIVFDFAARYAFEFDYDDCKKLYVTKVFAPKHGESFGIDFDGERDDIIFDSFDLSASAGAEDEFMWTLTHATTMNSSDFTEYINENGLWFYYAIIDLEEGESFSLKNLTTGGAIGADHISEITGDITALTRDGDLVSVKKSGRFNIMYLPAFNSFTIECDTTDPLSEICIYADEELTLIPDENGDVFYNGLSVTASSCIMIFDARNSPLPIILDDAMDKSLVDVTVYGDYYYAYTNTAGTCNLKYNVYTGVLYLEYVGGEEEEPSVPYKIYIAYNNKLDLTVNPDNPDEMCYLGFTMGAWDEFKVWDTDNNYIVDMTLAAGTAGIVTDGRIITFQTAGTYDFYINKTTHEVRLVAASGSEGGGDDIGGDDPIISDKYIIYHEGSFINVNSEGNIVKYTGLVVSAGDSLSIMDSDYEDLPVNFDPSVDTSLAKLHSAYNMVSFVWNCKADLTYNVETGVLSLDIYDVNYADALVYLMHGSTYEEIYSDEYGIITKRFEFTESSNVNVCNSAFEALPMILHEGSDSSLLTVMTYKDGNMLYIPNAGVYDFTYDLNSKIFTFEAVPET